MNSTLPQSKRESTGERQNAIARAARDLIVEKGFEGLRTRDVADRVGINIATLHYHVPSKNALVELVATSIRAEFQAQEAKRPRTGTSARRQLQMELEDFRETLVDMPDLAALIVELAQRARRDEAVGCVMRPLHQHWIGQFCAIFERGRLDGSFRPDIDPMSAAHITVATLGDHWRNPSARLDQFDGIAAEIERAFLDPAVKLPPQSNGATNV